MNQLLERYGMNQSWERKAEAYPGLMIARVTVQHRELYRVAGEKGELDAEVSGRFAFQVEDQTGFPAVGDWVMVDRDTGDSGNAIIHYVLPRKSIFLRQAAGTANEQQVVAANIDIVFICMSLNTDFNLRRVERYLTIAWDSMATPVILLTKADLCEDLEQKMNEISTVSIGVDVVACSSADGSGVEEVKRYLEPGKTIALIGSSGVGKSTLINRLLGEDKLATRDIREGDDKGRHTTTFRQMLLLPGGGVMIDTPGMRELQVYSGNLTKTFEDIEDLAAQCKYSDCTHGAEPGCAVKEAIARGTLSEKRFENYQKLQREMTYEGLNSRQLENEKISRMFGSKKEMKQMLEYVKNKKRR